MNKLNAVLLAGGESSRFGSDKALISFDGMTLIEYIYNNLQENFSRVIVVGSQDKYSFLKGAEIREDIYQDSGPLAGIYTGLYYSESRYNFICGCDMPFLDKDYFDLLKKEKVEKPAAEIIVPRFKGYLEPLAAIYKRSLLAKIRVEILNNNLKIKSFYQKSSKRIIKEELLKKDLNIDLERLFFNLNYPEDLEKALNYLMKGADKIAKAEK